MSRGSTDREAIEAEIERVRSLGLHELRTLWRATLRSSPPPALSKDLVARFLCWYIQEQALGGLDLETAKTLGKIARGGPEADGSTRLKVGTVLVREYRGERHTVTVVHERLRLERRDLREPFHHRALHHRHGLERPPLLRHARRAEASRG
jgi:Protein of unknown function (DUF2924)